MKTWNYRFDLEEIGASIFSGLEYMLATYLQETKIDNVNVRRAIHGNLLFD